MRTHSTLMKSELRRSLWLAFHTLQYVSLLLRFELCRLVQSTHWQSDQCSSFHELHWDFRPSRSLPLAHFGAVHSTSFAELTTGTHPLSTASKTSLQSSEQIPLEDGTLWYMRRCSSKQYVVGAEVRSIIRVIWNTANWTLVDELCHFQQTRVQLKGR